MVVLTRFQVNNNLLQTSVVRCAIWYHLYKLKSVKNTHGEVLKSNIPPWVFFRFSKLYKWYEIAQNITCKSTNVIKKSGNLHEYLFPEKDENVILQFDLENWPNFRQMRFSPKVTLHLMKALMRPSLLQTDFVCDKLTLFVTSIPFLFCTKWAKMITNLLRKSLLKISFLCSVNDRKEYKALFTLKQWIYGAVV